MNLARGAPINRDGKSRGGVNQLEPIWLYVGTDHVAEQVADLNYMLQEAHNTLRTLHHERELAEPIEQRIKRLRSRTAGHNSKRSSATV